MLKRAKNERAQAITGEYALTLFMVILVVVGMTVYFKRAVQGRIFDARNYMVNEVGRRVKGQYKGDLYFSYEPYYVNTNSIVDRAHTDTILMDSGGSSGIFTKVFDQTTTVSTNSETLPPRDFNATR